MPDGGKSHTLRGENIGERVEQGTLLTMGNALVRPNRGLTWEGVHRKGVRKELPWRTGRITEKYSSREKSPPIDVNEVQLIPRPMVCRLNFFAHFFLDFRTEKSAEMAIFRPKIEFEGVANAQRCPYELPAALESLPARRY